MFWRSSKASAPSTGPVWLLGSHHPNADRSIGWEDDLPDFSDPDVLIVDMTTLTKSVLKKIAPKLDQAHRSIRDRFFSGGTVVAITQPYFSTHPSFTMPSGMQSPYRYSNYHIFPVTLTTTAQSGTRIKVDDKNMFKKYVEHVKGFSFYINDYELLVDPKLLVDARAVGLTHLAEQDIKNFSNHDLGFTLVLTQRNGGEETVHPNTGRLVFLPPPTEPAGDAIGKILSVYGRDSLRADVPTARLEMSQPRPADKCVEQSTRSNKNEAKVQDGIDTLDLRAAEIAAHRRLLDSRGPELEDAVVRAFEALGFGDIRRIRDAGRESATFGMSGTGYSHGVIATRGYEKEADAQGIIQCAKWAGQRAMSGGRSSKGLFVPNQYCTWRYPESRRIKTSINPDQVEQAKMNDICIIPTCVLFEAVRRVLEGRGPDRAGIVARIAATRGVLEDAF